MDKHARLFSLFLALCGCGPTVATDDCRANCIGCCTADGLCLAGNDDLSCGTSGLRCQPCSPGQLCQLGFCGGSTTCAGCTVGTTCRTGDTDDACGSSGTCAVCGTGAQCTNGRCVTQVTDGGALDPDAGLDDSGTRVDAGAEVDAGLDAGVVDAGFDAGQLMPDGGMRVCASGDTCTASYANGGCCAAYPNCRGTIASTLLKCRASCGTATVACASTNDCCAGLACEAGVCATPTDAGSSPLDAGVITSCTGLPCATFNECCANATFCRGATTGAPTTCQRTAGTTGQRCIERGDCSVGLTCNSGVCGLPPCHPSGAGCTGSSQCCTGAPFCTGTIFSPATRCSAARGPQGAPCVTTNDCNLPYSCVQGFCTEVSTTCRMLHASCQSAFACCDGVGLGDLWCSPGRTCYPLACGGFNDLCPGGENDGCCSGLVCFGGLCKPPSTVQCDPAGAACLLDTCCSGLFCNSHSGNCEVPQTGCGQLYSACTSSTQCCTSTGLFCNNGTCDYGTACRITGQSCAAGEVCCGGLTCTGGSCQPSSTCRSSGSICSSTSPCCSGLTCTGGSCQVQTSCRSSGQTCGGGTQCCNQLACTNGVCQAAPTCSAAGTTCASGSECCTTAHFCRGVSATSVTSCATTCATNGIKAASQGDCCAGLSIDSGGVCRSAPSCLGSAAACLSSTTPCCPSAPYCRATTATGTPGCSLSCASDGMRAKSAADCCAGTNFDAGGVCRAPPTCKPSGQTCNGAAECCASVPYCGASTTNQLWACRSACVPLLGSASSTNDCCSGLVKNSLGWCDTPCGSLGTACSNNGACCSLSCSPTRFTCN